MGRLCPPWQKFPVSLAELCIDTTLQCGQSFRWRKLNDEWRCALHGRIISLKQDADYVYYRATFPEATSIAKPSPLAVKPATVAKEPVFDDTELFLRSYFNLQIDLRGLYEQWSRDDTNFRKKAPKFSGIRILNQDAWEALVCFICSSNNNISRISQMAHKLCLHYGPLLGAIDGEPYHDFPTPKALAAPSVENHLRQLGFGYRAKYIAKTAQTIVAEKPIGWLPQLRNAACPSWPGGLGTGTPMLTAGKELPPAADPVITYKAAHEQLLLLSGVGPKVADCVCLMGLGWGEAVPVDTHVWQIAVRDYKFKKGPSKTFSKAAYDAVGDHFRDLWGTHAGWAQSVLFTANLRVFQDRLQAVAADDGSAIPTDSASEGKKRVAIKSEDDASTTSDAPAALKTKRKRRRRG